MVLDASARFRWRSYIVVLRRKFHRAHGLLWIPKRETVDKEKFRCQF